MPALDFASKSLLILAALAVLPWLISRRSLSGLAGSRKLAVTALRSLAVLLASLALARPRLLLEDDSLGVIFAIDRSESIPREARERVVEEIRRALQLREPRPGDSAGVVAFAGDAGTEVVPREGRVELGDLRTLVRPEATDIAAAIELATASFPGAAGGRRVIVFSDGNETRGDAVAAARRARSAGIQIDVVPIEYSHAAEISVEKVIVPPDAASGEPYAVQAVVQSSRDAAVRLHLFEDGALVDPRGDPVRRLRPGRNHFELRGLRRDEPGRVAYEVRVEPLTGADDTVLANNAGHGFTVVRGEPAILLCIPAGETDAALVSSLAAEGIRVDVRPPDLVPQRLEDYLDYGVVVLSNAGAHRFSAANLELLHAVVKDMGLGFVMIGGDESFGAGGYKGTPIADLLPVELDVPEKRNLPNGALALIVHSSELQDGNYWARRVVQQAIQVLSERDHAGVVYFDDRGQERWLFPMSPCTEKAMMLSRLRDFRPGDMLAFEGVMEMALGALAGTSAGLKHIVILTDGDPSVPSDDLVRRIVDGARISISTVCYGAHANVLPETMRELASRGRGKSYFLRGPDDLPEIVLREAATVRKTLISELPFQPLVRSGGPILQGIAPGELPPLDGYVLTSPRPRAAVSIVRPAGAEGEPEDPVLATWTYFLGRTAAFTSDAGRRWGGKWAAWSGHRRFWSQLVRWVSRPQSSTIFRVGRDVRDGVARVVVDLVDESGDFIDGRRVDARIVPPAAAGETRAVELRQTGPGRYEGLEFSADVRGTYGIHLSTRIDGTLHAYSTGVTVSYAAEHRQTATDLDRLARIAEAGGGRVLAAGSRSEYFSRRFPLERGVEEAWSHFVLAALASFFADICVRRLPFRRRRRPFSRAESEPGPAGDRAPPPSGGESRVRAEAEIPAPEPASYTARLIEAKRRALGRDGGRKT